MAVPYTFGSATTSIPLSQLDSNFATTITLGNTAVQLGNTITNLTGVSNVASAGSLSLGSNGNTTAITVDTSQNVGIGTTTITTNQGKGLIVGNSSGGNISIGTNGQAGGATPFYTDLSFRGYANAETARIRGLDNSGTVAQGVLQFYTASLVGTDITERMRIDSSGNVAIGTTSSNSKLLVADTNNRTQSTAQFSITGNGYSAYHFLDSVAYSIGQNSDYRNLKMYSGSNSGVGVQLAAGGTSWGTYSDERIKTGLAPIENALTKVSTLRAVTGRYNTDEDTVSRAFLIAQDVKAVLPEAVDEERDELKTLTLKYTEVIPLLVASIKELKAINDTQAETINALTARIVALEAK